MLDSFVKVIIIFINLIKFRFNTFQVVLRVHTWLSGNSFDRCHVVYLETLTFEANIKDSLPKWDRATPINKKVRFSCMELLRWIEVGWMQVALAQNMRMASNSSCNLLQKEVDRMKKENIIVLASTVWMEDDNYLTTYGTIYCVMGWRRITRRGYGMVKWLTCRVGPNLNRLM